MGGITIKGRPVEDPKDREILEKVLRVDDGTCVGELSCWESDHVDENGDKDITAEEAKALMDLVYNDGIPGRLDATDVRRLFSKNLSVGDIQRACNLFSDNGIKIYRSCKDKDFEGMFDNTGWVRDIDHFIDAPFARKVIKELAERAPSGTLRHAKPILGKEWGKDIIDNALKSLSPGELLHEFRSLRDITGTDGILDDAIRKASPKDLLNNAEALIGRPDARELLMKAAEDAPEAAIFAYKMGYLSGHPFKKEIYDTASIVMEYSAYRKNLGDILFKGNYDDVDMVIRYYAKNDSGKDPSPSDKLNYAKKFSSMLKELAKFSEEEIGACARSAADELRKEDISGIPPPVLKIKRFERTLEHCKAKK